MVRLLYGLYGLLAFVALTVVFATAWGENANDWLGIATQEGSVFEWASVLLLLAISAVGVRGWMRSVDRRSPKALWMLGFGLLALVGAMEEISWGQHLFGFESAPFFAEHNDHHETNLHNFIPAHIFSSMVYSGVYVFFVFAPMLLWAFPRRMSGFKPLSPSPHAVLVIMFGSAFQAYGYPDPGGYADTATLFAALSAFGFLLATGRIGGRLLWPHVVFVVASVVCFIVCRDVFAFFNRQYEIREAFVMLGMLIWIKGLAAGQAPGLSPRCGSA